MGATVYLKRAFEYIIKGRKPELVEAKIVQGDMNECLKGRLSRVI